MSERKYRHRGYQDTNDDRDRSPGRRPPALNDGPRGPRGRGLGKPTATVFRCSVCGTRQRADAVEVGSVCMAEECATDLYTCTHCAHFNPAARWECRQPIETRVANKATRNDCSHFTPKASQELDTGPRNPVDAKSAFDALFKF